MFPGRPARANLNGPFVGIFDGTAGLRPSHSGYTFRFGPFSFQIIDNRIKASVAMLRFGRSPVAINRLIFGK